MEFNMKVVIIHSEYAASREGISGGGYEPFFAKALAVVQANIDLTFAQLREAGEAGADIAVTNEDFGHMGSFMREFTHPSCFGDIVRKLEAPVLDTLCAIAKQYRMYIAANEYETAGDGIFNTTKLIGRDGEIVGRYQKIHLPSGERFVVQPGRGFGVFKTDLGNIGFAICYDMLFPEHCRILAMNGADMVIHQTQGWFPGGSNKNFLGEHYVRVRATENRVYLIVAKNPQEGGGMSCIVDNLGNILASRGGVGRHLLVADIEPDFDVIDTYDFDNYFAGLKSMRARHLLHREPATYGRLLDADPAFPSDALAGERMCTFEGLRELEKALEAMPDSERNKMHW